MRWQRIAARCVLVKGKMRECLSRTSTFSTDWSPPKYRQTAKHFEGPQADQKQMQLEETAGIPTGLAPDIHRQVELRRAKQRKPAPDNLAPETPESPA